MKLYQILRRVYWLFKRACLLLKPRRRENAENLTATVGDLELSRRLNESVSAFWERSHNKSGSYYISDYHGRELWESLDIAKRIVPGAKVLEIGVGGGSDIRSLYETGCEVHVLDISRHALDKVRNIAKCWPLDAIGDIPKDYFDVIISHLVAQHMNDDDLKQQFRHCLPCLIGGGGMK